MESVRETAGVTLRAILRYVREHGGEDAAARVLLLAGEREEPAAYDDPRRWWSYDTKIAVFDAAARVLGDDAVGFHVGQAILAYSVHTPLRLGLLMLGGPAQLIRLIAKAGAKFSTAADMATLRTEPGEATVQYRLRAGYRPSNFDCDYTRGLLTQVPVLFGLPLATVTHDVCQVRGAEACVYTVRWRRGRLSTLLERLCPRSWLGRADRERADRARTGDELAARISLLQRTVAELVSAQQADRALAIVADRAGYAVNASAFLLVAQPGADKPRQVHGFGLSAAEIEALTGDGPAPAAGNGTLVVDIASATRYYGYLVAYCDDFLDSERQLLDAYANLAAVTLDALSALETAEERQRIAEKLLTLAKALTHAGTFEEVATVTAEAAHAVMRADSAAVMLLDGGRLRLAAHLGFSAEHLSRLETFVIAPEDTNLFARFLTEPGLGRTYNSDHPDPFIRTVLAEFDLAEVSVVSIALPDRVFGILIAGFSRGHGAARSQHFITRMSGVADQAATVLRTCELLDQTWRLAHVDALTGLANRRAFMSALEAGLSTGDGAVLFIDLDAFKAVNDSLGHGAGDELLAAVAGRLTGCVRAGDVVARLGGDEFVTLSHGTDGVPGVRDLAARVRAALTDPVALRTGQLVEVRASVGGTVFRAGERPDAVLHRADVAMYRAKRAEDDELVLTG